AEGKISDAVKDGQALVWCAGADVKPGALRSRLRGSKGHVTIRAGAACCTLAALPAGAPVPGGFEKVDHAGAPGRWAGAGGGMGALEGAGEGKVNRRVSMWRTWGKKKPHASSVVDEKGCNPPQPAPPPSLQNSRERGDWKFRRELHFNRPETLAALL